MMVFSAPLTSFGLTSSRMPKRSAKFFMIPQPLRRKLAAFEEAVESLRPAEAERKPELFSPGAGQGDARAVVPRAVVVREKFRSHAPQATTERKCVRRPFFDMECAEKATRSTRPRATSRQQPVFLSVV